MLNPKQIEFPGKVDRRGLSLLAILFLVSLFIPLRFTIGSFALEAYRVVLLIALFPSIIKWLTGSGGRVSIADVLIILHVFWASLAIFVVHGASFIEAIGIYAIEVLGTYFLARTQRPTPESFRQLFFILWVGILISLPIAMIESTTNQNIIIEALGQFTAIRSLQDPRLGLFRAQTFFDHTILYGIVAASIFAPTLFILVKNKNLFVKTCFISVPSVATFLSLSSGAFAFFGLQVIATIWGFALRTANRWKLFAAAVVGAYVFVEIAATRSPYTVLVYYLSFNSHSAYNRILIWDHATDDVLRNPLFGIGFNDWDRPYWMHSGSTDNFWLVVAVRYGLPGLISLMLCLFFVLRSAIRKDLSEKTLSSYRTAYCIMLISFSVAIINTHLWSRPFVLLIFYIGMAGLFTMIVQTTSADEFRGRNTTVVSKRRRGILDVRS
ncbi:MAG: O-antigen ligase family protein [Pseudomonadota bacterium]